MKLLIITQKVDKDDDVLGFFHGWLREFSKHFEKITVICLYQGRTELPSNVQVLSLGKEHGVSRIKYVSRFLKYIWVQRKNYDAVFTHMNAEYILLGWWLWRLQGKRFGLWYNHTYGTWKAKLAFIFADALFHTSPYALSAGTSKSIRMPAGIDTNLFAPFPEVVAPKNSVLYVGRISKVKKVDVLISAVKKIYQKLVTITLDIFGSAGPRDTEYANKLSVDTADLQHNKVISFMGSVPNYKTPAVYNNHEVFVNLTPKGNYDKTVLEAMACEKISIVSSEAFADLIPAQFIFKEGDATDLAQKLESTFALLESEKKEIGHTFRQAVIEKQSLDVLAKKLSILYSSGTIKPADIMKLFRYVIAGVTATGLDLVLLYIFTDFFGIWYMASATMAFALALFTSFILQKFWTFKDGNTEKIHKQIILYVATGCFSIGLNSILLYSLVEFLHIHYLLSQVIGNIVIAIVNFIIYQWLIFKTPVKNS